MSLYPNGGKRTHYNSAMMLRPLSEKECVQDVGKVKVYYLTDEEREKYPVVKKEGAKCRI